MYAETFPTPTELLGFLQSFGVELWPIGPDRIGHRLPANAFPEAELEGLLDRHRDAFLRLLNA